MAKHIKQQKSMSWSTGALLVMMASCIVYGYAEVWAYSHLGTFLPSEYTALFAAVFVSEIGGMAWIKVNKDKPKENKYLEQIGIYGGSELAKVTQAEQASDPDSTQPLVISDEQGVG